MSRIAETSAVVLGGGVSAALELLDPGARVTLIGRGVPGSETCYRPSA